MTPEDAFWAARLVSKFSNETIRAIVAKARYSEPGAAEHITSTLITRRDKVLRTWLTGVNPLVNAQLSNDGVLTFENAAVDAGVAKPATQYRYTLSRFDNAAGAATPQTEGSITAGTSDVKGPLRLEISVPKVLDAPFVQVSVSTIHPDYPGWSNPVTFTFRRNGTQWETVGLDRNAKSVVQK
jgi:hypothetical protein